MSYEENTRLLELARLIVEQMPGGWQFDERTNTRIAENDLSHYVGLTHPAYPGTDIGISVGREKGKLSISANYPRDWVPYIDGRGRVYQESIGVSMSKTPEQIAKDIRKRLIEDTGYLVTLADCLARQHESETGYDAAETLARELAVIAGQATEFDRAVEYERSTGRGGVSHNKTNDNRRKFGRYGAVECEVSHGAKSVELKLGNLSPETARTLLRLWKELKPAITEE